MLAIVALWGWCAAAGWAIAVAHGNGALLWPAGLVFLGAACSIRSLADTHRGHAAAAWGIALAIVGLAGAGVWRVTVWPGAPELLGGAVVLGATFGLVAAAVASVRRAAARGAAAWSGALVAAVAAAAEPAASGRLGAPLALAVPWFVLLLVVVVPTRRAPAPVAPGRLDALALVVSLAGLTGLVAIGCGGGTALPWLLAPASLLLLGAAVPSRGILACGALAALLVLPFAPARAALPERFTVLQQAGRAQAVYDRATQELQLRWDDEVVDAAGPDRPVPEFVATLLRAALHAGDRVLIVGLGTGRLPIAIAAAGLGEVDAVILRDVPCELRRRLSLDGPVPAPEGAARGWLGCTTTTLERALLQELPAGSRQAVVVGEPLHAHATAQVTVEMQRRLRRVAGDGLVVQPFALDRVPVGRLRALLAAAALAHPWNGVYAVGDSGVLVSAATAPDLQVGGPMAAWPEDARWLAHRAHVGSVGDLEATRLVVVDPTRTAGCVGEADPQPPLGERDRSAVLALLAGWQRADAASPGDADGLFLCWSRIEAATRRAVATVRSLQPDAEGSFVAARARAQALAASTLPRGAPRAELQAALGLPAGDGITLLEPAAATLRAAAIDPTLFLEAPPIFADLPRPSGNAGDLEDLSSLPEPARLAELAAGTDRFAVALRARFPSACARALLGRLRRGPLPADASAALRELADPFVLAEAGRILGGERRAELLAWWRGDLPMPAALEPMVHEAPLQIAAALPRRRDARALAALAELLVAADLEVRVAAATALRDGPGAGIEYDPEGPEPARIHAAAKLRSLHNRAP